MQISAINAQNQVNVNFQTVKAEKEEKPQFSEEGYEVRAQAPTDADLYKSMYGVKEEKSYAEQLAEHRAKYETDIGDKEREIEANRNQTEQTEEEQEKSYYEQYLAYKQKYE